MSPKPTKRDMVLLGGTRFETAPKTGRNWNDGTAEPKPSSGSRTYVLYNFIVPDSRHGFNRIRAYCCIWAVSAISVRDASTARSAPAPRLRAICFLLEPIPASLPHADSRVLAAPRRSSPASLMEMKPTIKKGSKSGLLLPILTLSLLFEMMGPTLFRKP